MNDAPANQCVLFHTMPTRDVQSVLKLIKSISIPLPLTFSPFIFRMPIEGITEAPNRQLRANTQL